MKSRETGNNLKIPEISIDISDDMVLTSLSCASIINEILKNLLYQKSQIPYTYNCLKTIIDRKRSNRQSGDTNKTTNFNITNHHRIVSNFHDNLEILMVNICNLFKSLVPTIPTTSDCTIAEILFVLGTTPICPKEIFSIRLNNVINGHFEHYHLVECKRNQHKVMRKIFLSETWMASTTRNLPCTNFYLFLKTTSNIETLLGGTIFMPCKPLIPNSSTKRFIVDLNVDKERKYDCCGNLEIFGDNESDSRLLQSVANALPIDDSRGNQEEYWFQSKVTLQGYKDCFINKVSASELW